MKIPNLRLNEIKKDSSQEFKLDNNNFDNESIES